MIRKILVSVCLVGLLLLPAAGSGGDDPVETVTDFDGNVYRTVKIGTQTWLAENLRSTHYGDGAPLPNGVMDGDDSQVDIHGRLYRWEAAVRGSVIAGDSIPVQGASPEGWHIPSDEDWLELIEFLGGEAVAGGRLKEGEFGAMPTGWFDFTGSYKGAGLKTFFRSSSSPGGGGGYAWELNRDNSALVRVFLHPDDAIPIRCIKDD